MTEIVDPTTQKLDWSLWRHADSFWMLLVLFILNVFYQWARLKQHEDMLRFVDNDYCIAYVRSQLLPATVARYKRSIQNGETSAVDSAKTDLKKLLE